MNLGYPQTSEPDKNMHMSAPLADGGYRAGPDIYSGLGRGRVTLRADDDKGTMAPGDHTTPHGVEVADEGRHPHPPA